MEEHSINDIAISSIEISSIASKKKSELPVESSEMAASRHMKMDWKKIKILTVS